ncbi:hypothetical protein PBV88_51905, partial [Streptomyces sp. T21Q-yed]|nr:hypothetical protein [Streptomyces sp. T21Q-yed]
MTTMTTLSDASRHLGRFFPAPDHALAASGPARTIASGPSVEDGDAEADVERTPDGAVGRAVDPDPDPDPDPSARPPGVGDESPEKAT